MKMLYLGLQIKFGKMLKKKIRFLMIYSKAAKPTTN